jgi:proline iminopeptidase
MPDTDPQRLSAMRGAAHQRPRTQFQKIRCPHGTRPGSAPAPFSGWRRGDKPVNDPWRPRDFCHSSGSMDPTGSPNRFVARRAPDEGFVRTDHAQLYYREIGTGQPILVIHGGPDFNHNYLLPEMDRLASQFRLLYYDQRGRGRSAKGVRADEVTIQSEIDDIECLRRHFKLESMALLGHSWGGLLAMEYATRHPARVSHLVLMNTAPASRADWLVLGEHFRSIRTPADIERLKAIAASAPYQAGDLEAEAEYYRIHFRPAVRRPEQLELVVGRLRSHFSAQDVLTARAIEHRLDEQTWSSAEYNLMPKLRQLPMPTLVIHGLDDIIPVELANHIAEAVPRAVLRVLPGCGHFAYLEMPEAVHQHIGSMLRSH